MIYMFLSRSITWPLNLFGQNSTKSQTSIIGDENKEKLDNDKSPLLISNRELIANANLSNNTDETKSLIEKPLKANLPSKEVLSVLGKHYLTKEDLENLIQIRMKQETPYDRVERFLWKDEFGKYPVYAKLKDWQCFAVSMSVGCIFGFNRKEEMKPVYVRQTSMLKFQDRLTAERAFRQFNVVMFMKEAYRVGLVALFITEAIMTSQYFIEAYRNKSTIYDCIPGGALVGFTMKMFHSPLAAFVTTIQGAVLGFFYGFIYNVGSRLTDSTYEHLHYEETMKWILYRENAELWSSNLEELPPNYKPPKEEKTWGLGWFKA